MSKPALRAPQILEMEIQGHTQQQIADTLGVSRMQIWRDRQNPIYEAMIQEFFDLYKDTLKELLTSPERYMKTEALKEIGRMYRAGMTKQIHKREDRNITANINIQEKRRRNEKLIRELELTPDQFRILENSVKPETQ